MKIATLIGLSLFTAVIGLSPLASAKPFGLGEKENHGEYVSEAAKTKTDRTANHGSYVSDVAKSGISGTTGSLTPEALLYSTKCSGARNPPIARYRICLVCRVVCLASTF